MGHRAIIKCQRSDAEWYFNNNKNEIERYKVSAITEKYRKNEYDLYMRNYDEFDWSIAIKAYGVRYHLYPTGFYTLWEGDVDLDVLSEKHYIYVEPLNKYLPINKVEVNTDGTVTYYVDYRKIFLNLREDTRFNAIERWLEVEYPDVEKFEELKDHKDDINEYKTDYERYSNDYYNPENQKKLTRKSKQVDIEKVEETEEENTHEKLRQLQVEQMSSGDVLAITSVAFLVSFVLLMVGYFIVN